MTQDRPEFARRQLLLALGLLPLGGLAQAAAPAAPLPPVEIWKEPTCGCCKDWAAHMEANGFKVFVNLGGVQTMRNTLGVPANMTSCHVARIGGYAVEGHVPARDIRRLLSEKPRAVGLAAPGMPIGSPGMDTPAYQGKKVAYDVMLIGKDGSARVWQHYAGNS